MTESYWRRWLKATGIRTIKTMAETALALITVGPLQSFIEIDWLGIVLVSLTSGVITVLTCIKGLPEVSV